MLYALYTKSISIYLISEINDFKIYRDGGVHVYQTLQIVGVVCL